MFFHCVYLSCFAHQVALIHREFAQHGCFQTDYQVSLIDHGLVLGLVGLTFRVELLLETVEQPYFVAVDQL